MIKKILSVTLFVLIWIVSIAIAIYTILGIAGILGIGIKFLYNLL